MRGYVTVATGKDQYYILAHNLLLSYRYHDRSKLPFVILCDRRNEWTADFDDVVIIENPAFSYTDKMRILDLSPFDETIFIESDCLIYRDLSGLWDFFKDSPDLGLLGSMAPIDSEKGWWKLENLGELRDKVDWKLTFQGGLYYVRNNGKDLPAYMETCKFIEEHYLDYHFSIFETIPEDETILGLAASVHHFKPAGDWIDLFAYYPEAIIASANILRGKLRYAWTDGSGKYNRKGYFIHFGTVNTFGAISDGLYYKEVAALKSRIKNQFSIQHSRKARLITFGRLLVNNCGLFRALAGLFPKEFRNKINNVKKIR